jgi:hypothetical protein
MEKILNENKLKGLVAGDKIYQVELESVDGNMRIVSHELVFDKYLDKKTKIEGLEMNADPLLAQLHVERAGSIPVNQDISCGYFLSEKEAVWEFVNMAKIIYEKSLSEYEQKFGKFE